MFSNKYQELWCSVHLILTGKFQVGKKIKTRLVAVHWVIYSFFLNGGAHMRHQLLDGGKSGRCKIFGLSILLLIV